MFTVLSKTRNSYLYVIVVLVFMAVMLLTFAVVQALPTFRADTTSAMDITAAGSDYYERHPELKVSRAVAIAFVDDFYLRHPNWINPVQSVGVPVTGTVEALDYFQRHPELRGK
jgi:cytochrome c oxidase assembly protein Cox11